MTTAINQQILALFAQGLSADQIAEALSTVDTTLDRRAVEYVLLQNGEIAEEDVPDADFEEIRRGLIDIAKGSEDDYLRAKVGMFLWEQKRGSAKMRGSPPVNILQINAQINAAQERVMALVKEIKDE